MVAAKLANMVVGGREANKAIAPDGAIGQHAAAKALALTTLLTDQHYMSCNPLEMSQAAMTAIN
jgi:hypothetical protein